MTVSELSVLRAIYLGVALLFFSPSPVAAQAAHDNGGGMRDYRGVELRSGLVDAGLDTSVLLGAGFNLGFSKHISFDFGVDYWKKAVPRGILLDEIKDTTFSIDAKYYADRLSGSAFRPFFGLGPAYHVLSEKIHVEYQFSGSGGTTTTSYEKKYDGNKFGVDLLAGMSTMFGREAEGFFQIQYRFITGLDEDRDNVAFVAGASHQISAD